MNSQNYQTIALSTLFLHNENVRTNSGQDDSIENLANSIDNIGLLSPLAVKQDGDRYGVVAGGRRLAALQQLEANDNLPESLQGGIPCYVLNNEASTTEVSLSENINRVDMTAADQIDAWGKLAKDGLDVGTIANRFGVTELLVKQRLALANVIPEVIDLLRAEEINLDTVKAFTLTDDPEKQRAAIEASDGHVHAWSIRRFLAEDNITANDRRVIFIGLEAYTEAGGKITQDLFDEDKTFIHDTELLEKMVEEKLTTECDKLQSEGWAWIETDESITSSRYSKYRQAERVEGEATPEEEARMKQLNEAMEDEAQEDDYETHSEEYDQIEEAIEARSYWTNEIKAQSGVFVSIDYNGRLDIDRGWTERTVQDSKSKVDGAPDQKAPLYSNRMKDWLGLARTQIVRDTLVGSNSLCNDIIAYNLAVSTVTYSYYSSGIGNVGIKDSHSIPNPDEEYPRYAELNASYEDLDKSWMNKDESSGVFSKFRELSPEAKQAWMNYAVARSLTIRLSTIGNDLHEDIIAELDIPWETRYRPDKDFFSSIKKSAILDMMRPVLGDEWADVHQNDKKGTLVEILDNIFAGQANSLTAEQQASVAAWVPEGLKPVISDNSANTDDDELDETDTLEEITEGELREAITSETDVQTDTSNEDDQTIVAEEPTESETADDPATATIKEKVREISPNLEVEKTDAGDGVTVFTISPPKPETSQDDTSEEMPQFLKK
jgi:ParB family chromosome partitioning protein